MTMSGAALPMPARSPRATPGEDAHLVAALRAGDEAAFATLLDRHHRALLAVARAYVPKQETAEEVVQETWLAVLRGIDRFEGRSALGTWIHGILLNRARTRGERERRSIPSSALARPPEEGAAAAVDPDRFHPPGHDWAGHWASEPPAWNVPEAALLSAETRREIENAIAALPPNQRAVITLRDVEGWEAAEVCNVLGLSRTNQRVLLHRARSRVRQALESYLDRTER